MYPTCHTTPSCASRKDPWSVSTLNRNIKQCLSEFPTLWIQGEVSNLTIPRSGHAYFTLKDTHAQVACAWFRAKQFNSAIQLKEGLQICVQAHVSLYEPRGNYQLIIDHIEPLGQGALYQAFEDLKKRLSQSGLFDPQHKQPLPVLPHTIGLITSPTGAAIQDIIAVLKRRYPMGRVILYPAIVQGAEAPKSLIQALQSAIDHAQAQVLILARGGGAYEDLWGFNDEALAQHIAACPIPLITGIGHEIDTTIADFVADQRAPTPSAAAETCTPDQTALFQKLRDTQHTLLHSIQRHFSQASQLLKHLTLRCQHPRERLTTQQQACDHLEQRLHQAWHAFQQRAQYALNTRTHALFNQTPSSHIQLTQQTLTHQLKHLISHATQHLERAHTQLAQYANMLNTLSPLHTLSRGYARVTDTHQNPITTAQNSAKGDVIQVHFQHSQLTARVESTNTLEHSECINSPHINI